MNSEDEIIENIIKTLRDLQGVDNSRISLYELCVEYRKRFERLSSSTLNLISLIRKREDIFDLPQNGKWVRFKRERWEKFLKCDDSKSLSPFEEIEDGKFIRFFDGSVDEVEKQRKLFSDRINFFTNFEMKMKKNRFDEVEDEGEEDNDDEEEHHRISYEVTNKESDPVFLTKDNIEQLQISFQHIGYQGFEDYDYRNEIVVYRRKKATSNVSLKTGRRFGVELPEVTDENEFPSNLYSDDLFEKQKKIKKMVKNRLRFDFSHYRNICSYSNFNIFGIEILHGLGKHHEEETKNDENDKLDYIALAGYNRLSKKNEIRIVEINSGDEILCQSFEYSNAEYQPKTPIRYIEIEGKKFFEKPIYDPDEFHLNVKHQALENESLQYIKNLVYIPDLKSLVYSKDHDLCMIRFDFSVGKDNDDDKKKEEEEEGEEEEDDDDEKTGRLRYGFRIEYLSICYFSNSKRNDSDNSVLVMNTTTLIFKLSDMSLGKIDLVKFIDGEVQPNTVIYDISDDDDDDHHPGSGIIGLVSKINDDSMLFLQGSEYRMEQVLFFNVNSLIVEKIVSLNNLFYPNISFSKGISCVFYNDVSKSILFGDVDGRTEHWDLNFITSNDNINNSNNNRKKKIFGLRKRYSDVVDEFGSVKFILDDSVREEDNDQAMNNNNNKGKLNILIGTSNRVMMIENENMSLVKENLSRLTGLKWLLGGGDRSVHEFYLTCDYDGNVFCWRNLRRVRVEDERKRVMYLLRNREEYRDLQTYDDFVVRFRVLGESCVNEIFVLKKWLFQT